MTVKSCFKEMSYIDKFFRALKAKNNEYYTRYEDVKFFVENSLIKDYLKDKVVYLPCDTEESNIYKYLVDEKDNLGIKEILRTSDDYYSHLDLYEKADVVFTNPPFTRLGKWLKWLDSIGKKYISWLPMMGLYSFPDVSEYTKFIAVSCPSPLSVTNTHDINYEKHCVFDTQSGELKDVAIFIISNDLYFDNYEYIGAAFRKTFEDVKDKLFYVNDGYEVKQATYIPNDYYGYLYVPITSYIGSQHMFEYYGVYVVVGKDGKARLRIKVKLKQR